MPLYRLLLVLACLDGIFFAVTAALGITLSGSGSILRHNSLGLLTAMFTCFLHVLVLFYFIGTGKDIREAVEADPELRSRFVPWTRAQKRRVFPRATLSILLTIVATLMGGEVHSRILALDGGATLPLRAVPAWWVHLVLVLAALLANAGAFVVEIAAVRENRRGIEEINARLSKPVE
jgi:amino acid transporter